jgi:alginate O-acetyltransferase complex protein AlgI
VLFNSLSFVLFFGILLLLHNLPTPWRVKKVQLLVASYLFYAAWSPPFVLLLWLSTGVDWVVAKAMHRESRPGRRRLLLAASLATNLGVLGYFKYGEFLLTNFVAGANAVGVVWEPAAPDIILPVGISFYTFQTLAYTLDVYFKREEPGDDFLDFALFVTFFPQLVAGPIVRPGHLIPQFAAPRRATSSQMSWGFFLMTLGMFEKVVVADGMLAPVVEEVFKASAVVAPVDAWLGAAAFSGQIFCDFAGYSTTAIGCALALGFTLPDNFRFPYAAVGFSDFWQRWHISLSSWLRDYLYIPLGGNRRGPTRTQINLMLTMLIGGLWHGASWTFVVWGGLHGLYLVVERVLQRRFGHRRVFRTASARFVLGAITYLLVDLAWVFFRAPDFDTAGRLVSAMTFMDISGDPVLQTFAVAKVVLVLTVMLSVHAFMRERSLAQVVARSPAWLVAAGWATMAFLVLITQGSGDAFIYFQF